MPRICSLNVQGSSSTSTHPEAKDVLWNGVPLNDCGFQSCRCAAEIDFFTVRGSFASLSLRRMDSQHFFSSTVIMLMLLYTLSGRNGSSWESNSELICMEDEGMCSSVPAVCSQISFIEAEVGGLCMVSVPSVSS